MGVANYTYSDDPPSIGGIKPCTLPKFHSLPLKKGGWKTILSYIGKVTFQGRAVKLRDLYHFVLTSGKKKGWKWWKWQVMKKKAPLNLGMKIINLKSVYAVVFILRFQKITRSFTIGKLERGNIPMTSHHGSQRNITPPDIRRIDTKNDGLWKM